MVRALRAFENDESLTFYFATGGFRNDLDQGVGGGMSILLTDKQAALAALYGRGLDIRQRYQDALSEAELSPDLRRTLTELCAARDVLLAELADAQRASGMLPKAGNSELAALEALGDHLVAALGEEAAMSERLRLADCAWLAEIEDECNLQDWSPSELDLFERLAAHLRSSDALLMAAGSS